MDRLFAPISATEQQLLDAIIAAPEDDGPRLVYADWLLAEGDPLHGQLIMVQCQIARLRETNPEVAPGSPLANLRKRELELLGQPAFAWYPNPNARPGETPLRTERGFTTSTALWSRPRAFLANYLARERVEPFARHLVLFPIEWSTIAELGRRGAFDRFEGLYFNRASSDDPLDQLLAPGSLPRLRELNLEGVYLDPDRLDLLLAPTTSTLEIFSFGRSQLAPGTLTRLVERAPGLRKLGLQRAGLSDRELAAILQLELEELTLGGANLPPALCETLERTIPRCRIHHALTLPRRG